MNRGNDNRDAIAEEIADVEIMLAQMKILHRLIRRFFPKGTNFDNVTKEQVAEAERWINNYPRKLLGWQSAAALFDEELQAA